MNRINILWYDQVSEKPKQDQEWTLLYTEYWCKDELSVRTIAPYNLEETLEVTLSKALIV